MEITARFIGQDGSLQLRHGLTYHLRITWPPHLPGGLLITWTDLEGRTRNCPYQSMRTFLENWSDLVVPIPIPRKK